MELEYAKALKTKFEEKFTETALKLHLLESLKEEEGGKRKKKKK